MTSAMLSAGYIDEIGSDNSKVPCIFSMNILGMSHTFLNIVTYVGHPLLFKPVITKRELLITRFGHLGKEFKKKKKKNSIYL